jgi:hypothetical protein
MTILDKAKSMVSPLGGKGVLVHRNLMCFRLAYFFLW